MSLPVTINNQSSLMQLLSFLFIVSFAFFVGKTPIVADEPGERLLAETSTLHWYKGNMHTHSLWSDGDDYLEMIALWYQKHAYQFLVFTDHNVLSNKEHWIDVEKSKGGKKAYEKLLRQYPAWVNSRTKDERLQVRLRTFAEVAEKLNRQEEFLLIQGEEISDTLGKKIPIHLNVTNLKELIIPRGGKTVAETIQNNVNAVMIQRQQSGQPMIIHLNHPNFYYAITAEDLMRVVGERFFEVYNGHPSVHNTGDATHPATERLWDIILTKRIAEFDLPMMYGLATDDGHNYHHIPSRSSEPGRGWVNVLTDRLDPGSLIKALEEGKFYSSSGVTLKKIQSNADRLEIEIDPVAGENYTTEFIGTRVGYDKSSYPVLDQNGKEVRTTRIYSKQIGEVLATVKGNSATYKFQGDEIYVRARVTSDKKHPNPAEVSDLKMAWVQPVLLKKGKQLSPKQPVTCQGTYPHHLQGVDIDNNGIYWSFTTKLVKTDKTGELIKKISVPNHHGDLCVRENRIYVAVNLGKFNDPRGNADSWVYVYSTQDLALISRHEVQEVFHGAGGIGSHKGHFFVVGGLPNDIEENYVYEYDKEFQFLEKHILKSGHTHLGIQTATFAEGKWWFGCYGSPATLLVSDPQFKVISRHSFDCSLGISSVRTGQLIRASDQYDKQNGHTGSLQFVLPDKKNGLKIMKSP